MKLHRLHLRNFRQFRSESVEFAVNKNQNVTVIHGGNGSGKTTIKNAFLWVLYGQSAFTLRPDKLANQGAMAEIEQGDTITVEVTLEFEHETVFYKATRKTDYQKQSEDDYFGEVVDEQLQLNYETENGDRGSRQNPQRSIEQILPERLSDLFFFDGEYITHLSEGQSQEDIQKAIENIMGLTILERAMDHLDTVERQFSKEVQNRADSKLRSLINERDRLRDKINDKEKLIETKRDSRNRLDEEIAGIDAKLQGIEEVADLQQERAKLEEEIDDLKEKISGINNKIDGVISKKASISIAIPAVENTAQELDQLREKGEIPSEISNKLVTHLLEQQQCICGRELNEGTEHYDKVEDYQSNVAINGFEESAMQLISHLTTIRNEQREYIDDIDEHLKTRSNIDRQLDNNNDRIDEIEGELASIDVESSEVGETPSELQQSRDNKIGKKAELKKEIESIEKKKVSLNEELEDVKNKISKAKQKKKEAELARKRMEATGRVRQQLIQTYEELKDKVRNWSNKLVMDTYREISTKEYSAEITDNFELRIRDQIEDNYLEVDKSRGERQIASLTFIGSLAKIARERYELESSQEHFSGGIYPIVMDSPYGALDDEHRRTVSKVIPTMAEQVIVLVTDSQWRGPVANELDEIADKQYRLNFQHGDSNNTFSRTKIVQEKPRAEN